LQLPLLLDMLQAAPQKIDLQRLAADFPFQFGHPALVGAALSVAGKRLYAELLDLSPPAVQDVGLTSQALATSATETPNPSRLTASSLNSLVNFRRVPMTQFSIR
jgi:hypothetical protein